MGMTGPGTLTKKKVQEMINSAVAAVNSSISSLSSRVKTLEGKHPVMKLVWTNSKPSSSFAEQTISFDSSYDAFIVYMAFATSGNNIYRGSNVVFPDASNIEQRLYLINFNGVFAVRQSTVYSNKIHFGKCISSDGQIGDTTKCIPIKIVGVKFN